ncbi:MAG: hypothetical protein GDA47_00970 [Rhodospirillales bacterium]|nr:hypothetical protein [Rhodospirillales bacterium]
MAAGLLFLAFLVNLVVAKLAILGGATQTPGLSDVGEFLVLLTAVLLFIIGCLNREAANPQQQMPTGEDQNHAEKG